METGKGFVSSGVRKDCESEGGTNHEEAATDRPGSQHDARVDRPDVPGSTPARPCPFDRL